MISNLSPNLKNVVVRQSQVPIPTGPVVVDNEVVTLTPMQMRQTPQLVIIRQNSLNQETISKNGLQKKNPRGSKESAIFDPGWTPKYRIC